VPEVASRQHLLAIIPAIRQAMDKALTGWTDIDAIAVTRGPGLAGSLLVGVSTAKALAMAQQKPLVGVNHLEAHIYANWLGQAEPEFPLVCLIVSGGHTDLVLMRGHGDYVLLGRTRDDAAGEAFDKAARILNLGYPGGPAIDRAPGRAPLPYAAALLADRELRFQLQRPQDSALPDVGGGAHRQRQRCRRQLPGGGGRCAGRQDHRRRQGTPRKANPDFRRRRRNRRLRERLTLSRPSLS